MDKDALVISLPIKADTLENRSAGIFWMLATMLCFITLDAIMKYALQTQPLVQVTWGRFFLQQSSPLYFADGICPNMQSVQHQNFKS